MNVYIYTYVYVCKFSEINVYVFVQQQLLELLSGYINNINHKFLCICILALYRQFYYGNQNIKPDHFSNIYIMFVHVIKS